VDTRASLRARGTAAAMARASSSAGKANRAASVTPHSPRMTSPSAVTGPRSVARVPGACADAEAKPALIIHHGTADDIVTIDSGEASRDFWVAQNGGNSTPTASFNGGVAHNGCPEGQSVVYGTGNWTHTLSTTATANIGCFFSGLE
jgi:hypothetical protein